MQARPFVLVSPHLFAKAKSHSEEGSLLHRHLNAHAVSRVLSEP